MGTLTAMDRCERCSAAALVRVSLPSGGELLFCGHHYTAFSPKLTESGAVVSEDIRSSLDPKAQVAPAPVVRPGQPAPRSPEGAIPPAPPGARPSREGHPAGWSRPASPSDQAPDEVHASPGTRVVKEVMQDSTIRVTRTNQSGRLSDGPAGEPAITISDYRTGRPIRIEHYDDGRRHDSVKGEAAELWYFADGRLYTRRHYSRGLLDDTLDEPAIVYLSSDGVVVSIESWTQGRRNKAPSSKN